MSVGMIAEHLYDQIRQRILCPGMRKIAMTYSVSNSVLYDTLHDCDIPDFMIDLNRNEERQKSYLRIGRILERLNLGDAVDASEDWMFTTKPKVFDAGMYAAMKSSYETIVDEIGDRVLFEIPPARYMDVLEIDGRPKLTFVEMAALSSLYMAIRGPAVEKLNCPLKTPNQVKRGKLRVKKIMDALHSPVLYQSLVRAVFDMLAEVWKEEYKQTLDVHCRRYWIKPSKQNLKYLDYVMEHHALESPRLDCDDSKDEPEYSRQTKDFVQGYEFIELLQYFFDVTCPLAERVALLLDPQRETDQDVNEWDYVVAERVGSVVKCYVDGVIRATEVLLECLPEVGCVKMLES